MKIPYKQRNFLLNMQADMAFCIKGKEYIRKLMSVHCSENILNICMQLNLSAASNLYMNISIHSSPTFIILLHVSLQNSSEGC